MRIVSWNVQWGRGADGRVDWARLLAALRADTPSQDDCKAAMAALLKTFDTLEGK